MLSFKQINVQLGTNYLQTQDLIKCTEQRDSDYLLLQLNVCKTFKLSKLNVDFELSSLPELYRSHAYEWEVVPENPFVLNKNSARVLKYSDATKLIAGPNLGAWEIFPKESRLRWHLAHPDLTPSFTYDQGDRRVWHQEMECQAGMKFELQVLWTKQDVEEWSRTPIGFFPTVCFTDHCDFDTPRLLQAQREIFKECGIKTTKGVFLYDYSHSPFVASLEHPGILEEIKSWEADGHEIAYHALSKSEGPASSNQFKSFESPAELALIETYIDHGFLSYNATRQPLESLASWFTHQSKKGLRYIWNYVDAFEATANCINQNSRFDSSLEALWSSKAIHQEHDLQEDDARLFKAWLSFGTNENLDFSVKRLNSGYYRMRKEGLKAFPAFLKSGLSTFRNGLAPEIWKRNLFEKNKANHFSTFSPIFYKNPVQRDSDILSFQTASVKNFETTFSDYALNKIQNERGVLIAHTYFGYTGENHHGRLFLDDSGRVNQNAKDSLRTLGDLISQRLVWNPTLKEMGDFYRKVDQIQYVPDQTGIKLVNAPGSTRTLS